MNRDDLLRIWARDVRSVVVWRWVKEATGGCVLLKGLTLKDLLYPDEDRAYGDIDLLVPPDKVAEVEAALTSRGYAAGYRVEDGLGVREVHASTWRHTGDGSEVDVHRSLPGLHCTQQHAWEILSRRTRRCTVEGREVDALDVHASALFVALHAASHGPGAVRPLEDLRRGVATWSLEDWVGACELARELDGLQAFGVGLGLVPEGAELTERLRVRSAPSTEQRLAWDGSTQWGAYAIAGFAAAPPRRKLVIAWRVVFPPATSMRMGTTLARRGPRGLAAAYLLRPVVVLSRFPQALRTWRSARRPGVG